MIKKIILYTIIFTLHAYAGDNYNSLSDEYQPAYQSWYYEYYYTNNPPQKEEQKTRQETNLTVINASNIEIPELQLSQQFFDEIFILQNFPLATGKKLVKTRKKKRSNKRKNYIGLNYCEINQNNILHTLRKRKSPKRNPKYYFY